MYIERLIILETQPKEKRIRNIPFSKGLNFVVDADGSAKGNNVGKTTVLRLIDICLGANDIKNIYVDSESSSKNVVLEKYIIEHKVSVILVVSTQFEEGPEKVTYELKVDLYPRGKKYINGTALKRVDYLQQLKDIFFTNSSSATFRQLIKKFVRIDLKGDNDKFLKFLHVITSNIDYINIYSTLFSFNNDSVNEKAHELSERLRSLDNDMKVYKRINAYQDENELHQRINTLDKRISKLKSDLDDLVNSQEFKLNEEEIAHIRLQYRKLQNELEKTSFERDRAKDIYDEAISSFREVDKNVLETLYKETSEIFLNLNKEFSQLVEFNNQLLVNKTSFYESLLLEKEEEVKQLKSSLDLMFEKNKDAILLIDSKNVEKYYDIQRELEKYQELSGGVKEVYERVKSYNSERETLIARLAEIDIDKEGIDKKIEYFNSYFSEYSYSLSNESYLIYYVQADNGFPLGITGSESGTFSTGTKKSTILAFDLAYLKYAEHYEIKGPKFIIHDVLESMDDNAFKNLVDIMNRIDGQYIVAVLKEKISSYDFVSQEMIKLELSTDNKLFKV
ncbi:DUF2326 domain-containing protein [Enterococcus sp. BWB1-3]|uniref:DUF2326 domain-containing protein n=1 Tax=Enterococcus sp. BWB1-3 TaxID=2787713 RepID=UPI001923DB1E|nr:DUF2326 domain-containing protein [Enterococcus sp. BWB1-3]MBL1228278.1 DUF2326 domain-containing protein [Enterococcus sp. BWB1-3]